ncbi:MAG: hypothetical protein EB060_12855, partial [Proteobacteria bacterium]|nr:hypothetical protein [Pseudomonadota bacterium]
MPGAQRLATRGARGGGSTGSAGGGGDASPIQLIVFDLDGTLIDTLEDIRSALNFALTHFELPLLSRESVMLNVGDGVDDLLRFALGDSGVPLEA